MTEDDRTMQEITPAETKEGPDLLSELVYREGQIPGQEDMVILPILKGIKHGISMGPGSANMSEGFEKENRLGVIARNEDFLQRLGMAPLDHAFLMLNPRNGEDQIVEVTQEMVDAAAQRPQDRADVETDIYANALVTTLSNVPLMVKPADCPSPIIYAKDKNGQPVLAVLHAGRGEVNALLPQQLIQYLHDRHGCDPKDMIVGISPGIGPKHYFIKMEDGRLIKGEHWNTHMEAKIVDDEPRIYLDMLANILEQFEQSGIPGQNIQAYGQDVDTYDLAAENPPRARSQRYSTNTKQPEKNGRILVTASL